LAGQVGEAMPAYLYYVFILYILPSFLSRHLQKMPK